MKNHEAKVKDTKITSESASPDTPAKTLIEY